MARTMAIPSLHLHRITWLPPSISLFIAIVAVLSVISIVSFLCGSHTSRKRREEKTVRLGDKRAVARLQSNISSKALLLAKMVSWRKVQDEGDEEYYDDEEAIWKKTIIKGEKCRPIDFSGKILYDSNGNQLPEHPTQGNDHV